MSKMDEQIIVVNRGKLFDNEELAFQGSLLVDGKSESQMGRIIGNIFDNYEVMRRGDAEENPEYKQPIPYAVIRRGDKMFVYKRLGGGGEERLHDKLSVGIGGHMNQLSKEDIGHIGEANISFLTILTDNLERELSEEIFMSSSEREVNIIGLINDDTNEVGKVHIGVLVVIDLSSDGVVEVREKDTLEGEWMKITDLIKEETYSRLESWSKFAIDTLI